MRVVDVKSRSSTAHPGHARLTLNAKRSACDGAKSTRALFAATHGTQLKFDAISTNPASAQPWQFSPPHGYSHWHTRAYSVAHITPRPWHISEIDEVVDAVAVPESDWVPLALLEPLRDTVTDAETDHEPLAVRVTVAEAVPDRLRVIEAESDAVRLRDCDSDAVQLDDALEVSVAVAVDVLVALSERVTLWVEDADVDSDMLRDSVNEAEVEPETECDWVDEAEEDIEPDRVSDDERVLDALVDADVETLADPERVPDSESDAVLLPLADCDSDVEWESEAV